MKQAHTFADVLAMIERAGIFQQAGGLIPNATRTEFKIKSAELKDALEKQQQESGDSAINVEFLTPPETELGDEADQIYEELMAMLHRINQDLDQATV